MELTFADCSCQTTSFFVVKVDSRPIPDVLGPWIVKPNAEIRFREFPYWGSSEMDFIERAKGRIKEDTERVTYRFEKA